MASADKRGFKKVIVTVLLALACLIHAAPAPALIAPAPTGLALGLAPAPGPAGSAPISVLFVLQAANATLTPVTGEARNYTLVASGVAPGVIAFTDTPVRFASVISANFFTSDPRFLVNGVWLDNPNVAVTAGNATGATAPEVAVLTMFSPTFDGKNGTLTAKVRSVEKAEDLSKKPKEEISFYFENEEAQKRTSKLATVAAPAAHTWYKPTFFIDNLVGFGNDFVGSFLDGGDYYGGGVGLI